MRGGGAVTAVEPTGQILGATVRGMDLSKPLSDADFAAILLALGTHGVLRFPGQRLVAVVTPSHSRRDRRLLASLNWPRLATRITGGGCRPFIICNGGASGNFS